MGITNRDRELIREDEILREMNTHTLPRTFINTKRNEYSLFLEKCISHCQEVGDFEIAGRLSVEYRECTGRPPF